MSHKREVFETKKLPPGGDFLKGDGTGSFSIYGDKFPVCPTSRTHSNPTETTLG